jgi:hypothetical protein
LQELVFHGSTIYITRNIWAVQVVLVDFVDEDALGIAAQEEEGERKRVRG